jgi:phosphohistidine phosphatase
MKTLLIFRHAQAVHLGDTSDRERPLTEKGVRDAQRMGRLFRGMSPDQVLCSTARRAQQTAREALSVANSTVDIQTISQLYDSDLHHHLNVLRGVATGISRLLIVGHNPSLETLVSSLAHRPIIMKTGALAVMALPVQGWDLVTQELSCGLVGLFYPAMLKKQIDGDEP